MRELNRKVLVIISALAVALLALPISAAFATKSETIEGTFTMLPTLPPPFPEVSIRPCGKSHMAMMTWDELELTVSGDMVGTGVYNGLWVIYYPNGMFGVRNAHAEYILEVEIGELSGQLTLKVNKGNLVIISGTGDLANLHGTGSIEGTSSPLVYAYSIDVHFDP